MSKIIYCSLEYTSSKSLEYSINFKPPLTICPIDKQEYCISYETVYGDYQFETLSFKNKCKFCSKKYEAISRVFELAGEKACMKDHDIVRKILSIQYLPIECIWTQAIQFILEI